jgi:hypothetical protein
LIIFLFPGGWTDNEKIVHEIEESILAADSQFAGDTGNNSLTDHTNTASMGGNVAESNLAEMTGTILYTESRTFF